MILKARHNAIIHPFFKWYATWKTERNFKPVEISGEVTDRGLPILLLANHISWWDGFWAMHINTHIFHRKFHFMMLENQLRKYWFFNHTGGYSVQKQAKSLLESLAYTAELLQDKNNLVLIFPQGQIQSVYNADIIFEKGIERILHQCENIQVVFMAAMIDYFSSPKPGLYLYLESYTGNQKDRESMQEAYRQFYHRSVKQQTGRGK